MTLAADPKLITVLAVTVGGLGLAAGILVFAIRLRNRQHETRETVWRKFALDNRMAMTAEPGNWLREGDFKIRGRVGEFDVEISTYRVQAGKSSQTWTKVRTHGRGPAGKFSVERKNLLNRAGALIGMRGESLDGGEFDEHFITHSSPESLAGDVFDEQLREHFARLSRSPKLTYSDGVLELVWHAGDDSAEQLSAAVQLHAMLRGAFVRMSRMVAL